MSDSTATVQTGPKLTHVLNLRAYMSRNGAIAGKHRNGATRHLAPLTGGHLKGVEGTRAEGLSVQLMEGGSDWLMVDDVSGYAHLDVRTHGIDENRDGFFIHYTGYLGLDDAAAKFTSWAPGNKTTQGGSHHWWTNPTFETSSEKFQWLTTNFFVGRGHWWAGEDGKQAVEYEIFEVSN